MKFEDFLKEEMSTKLAESYKEIMCSFGDDEDEDEGHGYNYGMDDDEDEEDDDELQENIDFVVEYIKEHCSEYLDNQNKPTIYRGMKGDSEDVLLLKANKGGRVSANTNNAYTTILDSNMPPKYPLRSMSFICTTNMSKAEKYGNGMVYVLFPTDKCKIGSVNESDIWDSKYHDGYEIGEFGRTLTKVCEANDIKKVNSIKTVADVLDIFYELIDVNLPKQLKCFFEGVEPFGEDDDEYSHETNSKRTIKENLNKYINVDNLGYSSYTPKSLPNNKDNEIWIGGNVIAIPLNIWEEHISKNM